MTQENEIKRPIQDLEHEPIKPLDNSEKGSKVSQALETVTTTAEKIPTPTGYCAPDSRDRTL